MPRSNSQRRRGAQRGRYVGAAGAEANGKTPVTSERATAAEPVVIAPDRNALLTTSRQYIWALAAVLVAVFVWAYWPTLRQLVHAWETQPDYSHGYFVVPLALYFLWARRDRFPGVSNSHWLWPGFVLLGLGIYLRYVSAVYFLQQVDGWSLLFWVAGIAWIVGGWKWFRWTLPSTAFLLFMIPLPYRVERWLSLPLQRIATIISGWMLQCFGLPALTEGNTILLGDHQLEIEQACSGLRIFVGIAALAFAYLVLVRRTWWEKVLLVAAVLPIALVANSARIVLTGILYEFVSKSAGDKFSHDLAGWLMIPFAALLFALTLGYLSWLFPHTVQMDVRALRRTRDAAGAEPQSAT